MIEQPQVLATPPRADDDVPVTEGEELIPASKVAELVAEAERHGKAIAWTAARREYQGKREARDRKVAEETIAAFVAAEGVRR